MDIKHPEAADPDITAFDRVIQDIREIRERQDSHFPLYRRARAAEADIPPEESLPLFLSTPDDPDSQPADPIADIPQQRAWQPSARQQSALQQGTRRQSIRQQDAPLQDIRYQDTQYQETQYQDTQYQDTQYEDPDTWLHDALESDRERVKTAIAPTFLKQLFRAGMLAALVVSALAVLFTLEDRRGLISHASASLAAVLPAFTAGIGRPTPASAKPQIAETSPTPVATVAIAPTREAIANAYQTALQTQQPEIRQPPAPPPAPEAAVRHLDPDELATLLKRAQGLLDLGDLPGARLLLERAADAHEAKAAFILAQTYDPAVIGTPDARSIAPDPAAARRWYEKAAQFGSQEAQQRLAQLQN